MISASQKGTISGVILAGVSLITIIGAVVGLAVSNQTVTTESQARIANSDVHLVKDSVNGSLEDERTVELSGEFCFSRYLQSGGSEKWTIYPSNETGGQQSPRGGSDHIDGGTLSVGRGFPAHCKRVDTNTGEAEWQVADTKTMQPHRFSVLLHFPQKLDDKYCPSVHLNYKGTWMSGMPFAKVDLKKIKGLCTPATTPSPSTSPSVSPSVSPPQAPVSPVQQPLPSPAIQAQGYITVYGCKKPESIKLEYCKNDTCTETATLPYNASDETKPVTQGIWLEDTNIDNTWIYRYNMTMIDGRPIDPAKTYRLLGATAIFDAGKLIATSKAEDPKLLEVKLGTRRDFQIYAEQTCACAIKATASIKDKNGALITELDNQVNLYGTANNIQFFQDSTRPNTPFRNGQIIVGPGNYPDLYIPTKYGFDSMASIKLFAPGWKILKQECVSKGLKPACPTLAPGSSVTADKLPRPDLFEHIRVTCGVEVEYGWTIEKLPVTPPPSVPLSPVAASPAPKPPVVPGDIITGLTCELRDDAQPAAIVNSDCKLQHLELRGVYDDTIELDWDRPNGECQGYKPESDQVYMAIIRRSTDGAVVAVDKFLRDQTPELGVNNREWDGIPGTKVTLDEWGSNVPYNLYAYAQKASNPSCVSQPVTFGFRGPK
ncbi:hypothetical protein KBC70_00495 [Candidatus Woesebacteria bacterium]|jgi:hypothetical protein|nr:hypothetical protein [Candidatus Woesebacteria bacterium]